MKTFPLPAVLIGLCLIGCTDNATTTAPPVPPANAQAFVEVDTLTTGPGYTLDVRPAATQPPAGFPYVHSAAHAQAGTEVLLIGGRTTGFHGISQQMDPFAASRADTSIWVIDLASSAYYQLPLYDRFPELQQLKAANFAYYQDADTLFVMGGYGTADATAAVSNTTFDGGLAFQVSTLINEVKKGAAGDPRRALLRSVQSPFLQVAGGELFRVAGRFYLCFGQDYDGAYTVAKTGHYTEALRSFRFDGPGLTDTFSVRSPDLHRRDLNVAQVINAGYLRYVAYSGVFNRNDNGYLHPIYLDVDLSTGGITYAENTSLVQLTSNYKAALVSVYDTAAGRNTHSTLGGIGRYQYDVATGRWEDGDNGALLPFVKTITHNSWQNGVQQTSYQLPPDAPELPALLGTNALFLPNPEVLYVPGVIDYQRATADQPIGWLYGGILAQRPTSSTIYPTSINSTLYEVYLTKTDH